MHMWLWYGYNLGPFLFDGIKVVTKSGLAGACITLFIVGFLFEGSKVYVARTQRNATRRLYPNKRNSERRNLLISEHRGAGPSQLGRGHHTPSLVNRIFINLHQTVLYLAHNVVGYLLMLAVMVYNVWVIIAVVLGMVLGYFVFGPMLTKLQTECFSNRGPPLCTDKCDDNAEGSTPPLLNTSLDSDFFICQTPSCSQSEAPPPTISVQIHVPASKSCHYGAKRCPSKVAVAAKLQKKAASPCEREERKDSIVEDTMLLPEGGTGCCTSTPPPITSAPIVKTDPSKGKCDSHQNDDERETGANNTVDQDDTHEATPPVSCCHSSKLKTSESQQNVL